MARAHLTRGPSVFRNFDKGIPAAKLTASKGRLTLPISRNRPMIA
jgi:hypothetical protein